MCWIKYHNHIHIKEIQSWIKQSTHMKHRILNYVDSKVVRLIQASVHFVRKDM
jgi:hypothetical protein